MKSFAKARLIFTTSTSASASKRCAIRNISTITKRNASAQAAALNANDESDVYQGGQNIPNPDPAHDSTTAQMVGEQAQYMLKTYARPPPMFVKGKGCYLWDVEDRKYLDLTAGIAVNALGHCDPEMTELIAEQVSLSIPIILPDIFVRF